MKALNISYKGRGRPTKLVQEGNKVFKVCREYTEMVHEKFGVPVFDRKNYGSWIRSKCGDHYVLSAPSFKELERLFNECMDIRKKELKGVK